MCHHCWKSIATSMLYCVGCHWHIGNIRCHSLATAKTEQLLPIAKIIKMQSSFCVCVCVCVEVTTYIMIQRHRSMQMNFCIDWSGKSKLHFTVQGQILKCYCIKCISMSAQHRDRWKCIASRNICPKVLYYLYKK